MKKHIRNESWEERDTDVGALYFEDSLGYQLPPHTDVPQKLVTCLIYCAEDDESSDMGTSLFKLKMVFMLTRKSTIGMIFHNLMKLKGSRISQIQHYYLVPPIYHIMV